MSQKTAADSVRLTIQSLNLEQERSQSSDIQRVLSTPISMDTYDWLARNAQSIEVGAELKKVTDYFNTPEGETPAGFRRVLRLKDRGVLEVDLVRDISRDRNDRPRPTKVLYSADSANPYEIKPIAPFLANLTCNPGIIYDLFLNNPEANVGRKYTTRDEVMESIGDILGPGCDISVELNNPFEEDFSKILDEVKRFEELLSPWRLVVKVPHTGPVNSENYRQLLEGDRRLDVAYDKGTTKDMLRGHQLALRLQEEGYRVNFTLMFEPYQTQLALQARPYFINSFIRHRKMQSQTLNSLLHAYEYSQDEQFVRSMEDCLVKNDYIPAGQELSDPEIVKLTKTVLSYRGDDIANTDGLDSVRHNLRALRNAQLPDTRLIICSMEGPDNYPDIDRLLTEPEFADMTDRIVVTAEPQYLARFTSTNQVVSYQRRFMTAAEGEV